MSKVLKEQFFPTTLVFNAVMAEKNSIYKEIPSANS